jgi:hypothetical protein
LKWDRIQALYRAAGAAQRAAEENDSKTVFSIVRSLAGRPPAPLKGIAHENGSILCDDNQTRDRWRRRFTELFKAEVVDDVGTLVRNAEGKDPRHLELLFSRQRKRRRRKEKPFDPDIEQVHKAIMSLNGDKGLGPDMLSAAILQAGGWVVARIFHEIIQMIIASSYVTVVWRGGRLIILYKGKGPTTHCDSFRGLLISDHASKVLTTLLQWHLRDSYTKQVGETQFGAVAKRSTALASLMLRNFMDLCKMMGWSCFVLFVDLSTAFDYAVREVVMGWMDDSPDDVDGRRQYLVSIGIPEDAVDDILDWLGRDGPLLRQMGNGADITGLVSSLHSAAWFVLPGDEKAIVTKTGGRQGCKLGGLVFNLIYSIALKRLRVKLGELGVVLKIATNSESPIWAAGKALYTWNPSGEGKEVVEVIFVDDEACTLAASSPKLLVKAIELLLAELVNSFRMFGFRINWSAGKTEAFVTFRGKGACDAKRQLFDDQKGKIRLPPDAGAEHLNVVDMYKHLGSVVASDGSAAPDVPKRVQSSMAAYAPLALKIFGASVIARQVRLSLATSLVFSRLLYNVQTWSKWTVAMYSKLNSVYMRALRRIAGMCRHGQPKTLPDHDVREVLGAPSLQCLIIRRRLELLSSVLRSEIGSLNALLRSTSSCADATKLPWVTLVISDLRVLRSCMGDKLAELGDPVADAAKWFTFICDYPSAWKSMLHQLHLTSLPIDAQRAKKNVCQMAGVQAYQCDQCQKIGKSTSFPSMKALLCHMRKLHGVRNMFRQFVDSRAICPVCRVQFETRIRAIAHLTETRCRGRMKQTCRKAIEDGRFEPLPARIVTILDTADARCRKHARAAGKTQVTVRVPAKRARTRGVVGNDTSRCASFLPYRPAKRLRCKTAESETHYVLKDSGFEVEF